MPPAHLRHIYPSIYDVAIAIGPPRVLIKWGCVASYLSAVVEKEVTMQCARLRNKR
jgi:hypothetical protein